MVFGCNFILIRLMISAPYMSTFIIIQLDQQKISDNLKLDKIY
jgi:hypothetical protein